MEDLFCRRFLLKLEAKMDMDKINDSKLIEYIFDSN